MASAGTVKAKLKVHVAPTVSVGATTYAGGTVSLVAFAAAIVAFAQGARDQETMSALGVGALSLVITLGGRYGQAIAAVFAGMAGSVTEPPTPTSADVGRTQWAGSTGSIQIPSVQLQPLKPSPVRPETAKPSAPDAVEPLPAEAFISQAHAAPAEDAAAADEAAAPFDADGEPTTGIGDFANYPLESFVADPSDTHGASDAAEAVAA